MNLSAMTNPVKFLIPLAASLSLAACFGPAEEPPGPSPDGVDLRGSTIGGDFILTAQDGTEKSWSDFAGQYRMVYFGFTYCPDICPTDVARASQGLTAFEEANPKLGAKVQPIFITVDPERDNVEALTAFAENFHPRLIALTGSQEAIDDAKTKFSVSAIKGEVQPSGAYDFEHTTFTYLFAPDGSPLGIIPTDKGPQGVATELKRWVR